MEGESRKVGDRIIPVHIFAALESGSAIELHAPLEKRLRILREDYLATPAHLPALAEAIRRLEPRLNLPEEERDLAAKLLAGAIDQVTEILLQRHYDPLYRHAERGKKYQLRIDSSDPRAAGREVLRWIESALR
jgi:tRNA 2-selenouridine synthase